MVGWPAIGNSSAGVKIRMRASVPFRSGGRIKVDSEKFISFAIACIVSAVRPRASRKTASWLPPNRRSVKTSRCRYRYDFTTESISMLYAHFITSEGNFTARLFDAEVPNTVANFVGLAEGTKEWTDPRTNRKVTQPYYNGTVFHRIIAGFMIQGGDDAVKHGPVVIRLC